MPNKSDSIPLSSTQDRRIKLQDSQREKIRELYASGGYSSSQLGKMFGVSKSLVQILVNKKREENVKQRAKKHWKDYQKSGEEWNAIMREHRHYKQSLYLKGELKDEKNIKSGQVPRD